MGTLARFKLSTRMQLLVGLTLVGLLVLCVTALLQLKGTMLEDRKEKVRNVVEVGIGIISHHHKLFAEGKLSEDDAKVAARNALRGLRYASNDYYSASIPTASISCMAATRPWKARTRSISRTPTANR